MTPSRYHSLLFHHLTGYSLSFSLLVTPQLPSIKKPGLTPVYTYSSLSIPTSPDDLPQSQALTYLCTCTIDTQICIRSPTCPPHLKLRKSTPYSTCLPVPVISFSKVTCPKQNSSSSLTNLFLTLSSPSQVNGNFILTAQAKNLESLISVFLPCHILTISKCCQLYLQCTSRIRLHHMTSTATHMNQTTITSWLDIVIDSYVGSGPGSCIPTVCSQTVARVTWKNLSQNISLLCPSKDFRFHSE